MPAALASPCEAKARSAPSKTMRPALGRSSPAMILTSVEHLSGGQRQAIELNRFVHWGGKLVILDEPFAALGVEQTRRGLETIDRVRSRGIAIVLITHTMAQAFAVADRIVVLRHGVVAGDLPTQKTTPDEVVHLITGGIERIGQPQGAPA